MFIISTKVYLYYFIFRIVESLLKSVLMIFIHLFNVCGGSCGELIYIYWYYYYTNIQ